MEAKPQPTGAGQQQGGRIVFLDYLRVFAFLSVLCGHKFYDYVDSLTAATVAAPIRFIASLVLLLINGGGAGVVVFFLVSGYIITHVLQAEAPAEFLIKRAFRIYPLYMFAVLLQTLPLALGGEAPPFSVVAVQLLLIGDLFGTPHALSGIEWTLRAEMLFYLVMAALRAAGLLQQRGKHLPIIMIGLVLLCILAAPIPAAESWARGYLTIYFPFLLVGVSFYHYEQGAMRRAALIGFTLVVFAAYYALLAAYQRTWLDDPFAITALLIFLALWRFRRRLALHPGVRFLSDLTYAVYLFHLWMFDYFKYPFFIIGLPMPIADMLALACLFGWCALMRRLIEAPGIRAGRWMAARLSAGE
jgi:peptidoglycan/LPS O-acetylase OafA/YrhL